MESGSDLLPDSQSSTIERLPNEILIYVTKLVLTDNPGLLDSLDLYRLSYVNRHFKLIVDAVVDRYVKKNTWIGSFSGAQIYFQISKLSTPIFQLHELQGFKDLSRVTIQVPDGVNAAMNPVPKCLPVTMSNINKLELLNPKGLFWYTCLPLISEIKTLRSLEVQGLYEPQRNVFLKSASLEICRLKLSSKKVYKSFVVPLNLDALPKLHTLRIRSASLSSPRFNGQQRNLGEVELDVPKYDATTLRQLRINRSVAAPFLFLRNVRHGPSIKRPGQVYLSKCSKTLEKKWITKMGLAKVTITEKSMVGRRKPWHGFNESWRSIHF